MPLRIFLSGPPATHCLGPGSHRLPGDQAAKNGIPPHVADAPPPPFTVDVLVAARSLPAGTLMKDEDLRGPFRQATCQKAL